MATSRIVVFSFYLSSLFKPAILIIWDENNDKRCNEDMGQCVNEFGARGMDNIVANCLGDEGSLNPNEVVQEFWRELSPKCTRDMEN